MTTITFTLTPDEQRRTARSWASFSWLTHTASIKAIAVAILFEIITVAMGVFLLAHNQYFAGVLGCAAAGFLPYLAVLTIATSKMRFRRIPQVQSETTWIIDTAGITIASKAGETRTYWRAIDSVSREGGFVVVKVSGSRILRLPERAINDGTPVGFIDYLERLKAENRNEVPGLERSPYSATFPVSPSIFMHTAASRGGLESTTKATVRAPGGRKNWKNIAGAVAWAVGYESIQTLITNASRPVSLAICICFMAICYVGITRSFMGTFQKARSTEVPTLPWMSIRGLMTVALFNTGIVVSWDGGSKRIGWKHIERIDRNGNEIVFQSTAAPLLTVPGDAFSSAADRDAFRDAAEKYQRDETLVTNTEIGPSPARL